MPPWACVGSHHSPCRSRGSGVIARCTLSSRTTPPTPWPTPRRAPQRAALAAVEVVDSVHALATRWRSGLAPLAPDALVSDLLVGRAGETTTPATLDEALPFATASLRVPAGSAL